MTNFFDKVFSKGIFKIFPKFVLACGFAAVINFSSRIIFSLVFHFIVAVILAYIIGMVTAFALCKAFVFEPSNQSVVKQFYYFTLVNIVAIIQTIPISIFLAKWLFPKIGMDFYDEEIAHFIGIVVPIISSYFGHKKFSFKNTSSIDEE
jgi:putative flippase GtrA